MAPQFDGLAAMMFGGGVSPTSAAPAVSPRQRLGFDPNFTQMARGTFSESNLPDDLQIPKEIEHGLDKAYRDSLVSGGFERGGNIVKKYGAGYEMRQGGTNYDDVGDDSR